MRDLFDPSIAPFRSYEPEVYRLWGWSGDSTCGCFYVPSKVDTHSLKVIVSSGEGWDHVSVSRKNRCPNWLEMDQIKRMFFKDDEVAMQLHPEIANHISNHDFCLHLWRPHDGSIPLPPKEFV